MLRGARSVVRSRRDRTCPTEYGIRRIPYSAGSYALRYERTVQRAQIHFRQGNLPFLFSCCGLQVTATSEVSNRFFSFACTSALIVSYRHPLQPSFLAIYCQFFSFFVSFQHRPLVVSHLGSTHASFCFGHFLFSTALRSFRDFLFIPR
jgi:hypothetical protein